MRLLHVHVASRLGQCEEDLSRVSTNDENEIFAKKLRLFGCITADSKKRKPSNSVREVERYFEEEIIHFDDDPLMYWKKKSEELHSLAALAKEYMRPTNSNICTVRKTFLNCRKFLYCQKKFFGQRYFLQPDVQ